MAVGCWVKCTSKTVVEDLGKEGKRGCKSREKGKCFVLSCLFTLTASIPIKPSNKRLLHCSQ